MQWIECRPGERIPLQTFFYDGWKTDRDIWERTPLMLWIEHRRGEAIPKEFFYDGY